jgi:hypothetical protein
LKHLRKSSPDPRQLALQLDFFSPDPSSHSDIDFPAPAPVPVTAPASVPAAQPGLPHVPADVPAAPQPGKRRIHVGNHILDYTLVRSKRRTIGFLIDDDGLRMAAPRWVTIAEIESAIREKQRWIFTKLNERRERSARRLQPQMQWRDGATLPYLGGELCLRIVSAQASGIAFDEATRELTVCLPADAGEQQLKDRVQGWLQGEAKRIFGERLPVYAEKLNVRYQSFALSSATTQWGSCTADGKIRLNWRLIHFAPSLIDYVIAHELAHLREMNHSPRFWATVQSIFPEFQTARKALREQGQESLPVF